jgi:hypothetical protein
LAELSGCPDDEPALDDSASRRVKDEPVVVSLDRLHFDIGSDG